MMAKTFLQPHAKRAAYKLQGRRENVYTFSPHPPPPPIDSPFRLGSSVPFSPYTHNPDPGVSHRP